MATPPTSSYRTQADDTDRRAEELCFERWRRMTPLEKATLVGELFRSQRELSLVGLRLRHPDADDEELRLREACLRLGPELMARVTGRTFED